MMDKLKLMRRYKESNLRDTLPDTPNARYMNKIRVLKIAPKTLGMIAKIGDSRFDLKLG